MNKYKVKIIYPLTVEVEADGEEEAAKEALRVAFKMRRYMIESAKLWKFAQVVGIEEIQD